MAETENQAVQKRQIAYKVCVKDILNGRYVKEEGWQPNYIEANGNKISRVNLIGTIVLKNDDESAVLDDGGGKIPLRVFEDKGFFKNLDVGDVILLIGRPREFGSEKYIMPEIVKKIDDAGWVKVRKLELGLGRNFASEKEEAIDNRDAVESVEEVVDGGESLSDKVFKVVKEFDKGDGARVEDVLEGIKEEGVEEAINKLLEGGEIFEVAPGKLKVLE
jgi:RPA family protein